MLIKSRYVTEKVPGLNFEGCVSKTQRQFRKASDINNIIAKYRKTGILGDPNPVSPRFPIFADFSKITDYFSAQVAVAQTKSIFERLPADVRAEFQNDVQVFMQFVSNPENNARLIELGLVAKPAEKPLVRKHFDKDGKEVRGDGSPVYAAPAVTKYYNDSGQEVDVNGKVIPAA